MNGKVNYLKLLVIVFVTTLTIINVQGCKKKSNQAQTLPNHPVPYVPINITIYPNNPTYFNIQAIAGWQYVNGGINGLIVYRKSNEEFVVIERTSSQLPDNPNAKVKVKSNFNLVDSISGSEWQIVDATVTKGPATWALRTYANTYDGNTLIIRN
jgi:hypothetical protein